MTIQKHSECLDRAIFFGGDILTINDNKPYVESVGIENGKIIATGDLTDIKKTLKGEDYQFIDLKGSSLLPGFIDSHNHLIANLFFFLYPNLSKIKNLDELKEVLTKIAAQKKSGEYILGLKFNEQKFENPQERLLPDRDFLDKICPNHPCFLLRSDAHVGVGNSRALALARIDEGTICPEGGEIKKKNGKITGVIVENAISLITRTIPLPSPDELNRAVTKAFSIFAEKGITSIHGILEMDLKGGVTNLGGIELPLLRLIKDKISQDCYQIIYTKNPRRLKKLENTILHDKESFGKYRVGGIKFWIDGAFGAYTAYMHKSYLDNPNTNGLCVIDIEKLYDRMKKAHNLGYQISVHAIGDKANRLIIDLYKKLLSEYPKKDHRHRIEHASLLTEKELRDIKELGLILSCQPTFLHNEKDYVEKRIGKERCKYLHPFRSIFDHKIILAAGSDCPVENPDVVRGLHAMVNRGANTSNESLSIKEALTSYTLNGAIASFQENIKGSIEEGKIADFVIMNKNPLKIPKEKIKDLEILATIKKGKFIFQKNTIRIPKKKKSFIMV